MPIANRYLLREIFKSSSATTLILFAIMMSNTLGRLLSDISAGDLPAAGLWPILLGQSVQVLAFLLPLGLFLGIVFAFGQLYKDHELVVLHACGFGYRQLYATVLWILIPLFIFTLFSSMWLSASVLRSAKQIVDQSSHVNQFQQLKIGQFNLSKDQKNVFFMQSMSADKLKVENVIITQKNDRVEAIETAVQGRNTTDEKTGDLFLEVGPGVRYENTPGKLDYKTIQFEKHGILLEKSKPKISKLRPVEKTPEELRQSTSRYEQVEFYWRLNPPISLLVLALIAIPLSRIAPRQGKYGKVAAALLIFIIYQNLLGFTFKAVEQGELPLWLNFWWVHGLFLLLAAFLLLLRNRVSPFSKRSSG